MKAQFYICHNPTDKNDPETYLYHAKFPRFHAKVVWKTEGLTLEQVDNIDEVDQLNINSKMKRMHDWYINVVSKK